MSYLSASNDYLNGFCLFNRKNYRFFLPLPNSSDFLQAGILYKAWLCQRQDHWSDGFSMRSCPERAYILAFFVCRSGFRRWAWPRLLTLSFLMFWKPFARLWYLLRVTFYSVSRFQTGFHGGYHSPFHFIACVAFSCYSMCRLHVGFSRRVSPSS